MHSCGLVLNLNVDWMLRSLRMCIHVGYPMHRTLLHIRKLCVRNRGKWAFCMAA